jgi:hypothetical protein
VVWFARGCKQCAGLGMHDLPVDDESHLLFRVQLPLWLNGSVDLHNCHSRNYKISCAVVMFTGWHYDLPSRAIAIAHPKQWGFWEWANTSVSVSPETILQFVHKCMKNGDAAHVAAARQHTR